VRSNGVGVVVETNNPQEYPLGRAFMHLTGWQQYCVVQSNPFPPITCVPEDVQLTMCSACSAIGLTALRRCARGRQAAAR
jgi:NADPH-dependent curcumin reductase CurA